MRWTKELDAAIVSKYLTHTRKQIADEHGLTEGQVRSRFWTLGLASKIRPWSDAEVGRLRAAYLGAVVDSEINLETLAAELGRDKANVCRKARQLGLTDHRRKKVYVRADAPKFATPDERRAHLSEVRKKQLEEHGHPRGALGLKHTEAAKAVISMKSKQFWARLTAEQQADLVVKRVKVKRDAGTPFANPRGTWKAAWREIGGQRCFFRSRWEANYARYLEWLRSIGQVASWQHEAHTFWFEGIKRGVVSYLPDFKVTNPGGSVEWHEVKGWMDARSKTTIARMGRYHPKEKLIVIREKQYREIQNKVSSLIPGWEYSDKDPLSLRAGAAK